MFQAIYNIHYHFLGLHRRKPNCYYQLLCWVLNLLLFYWLQGWCFLTFIAVLKFSGFRIITFVNSKAAYCFVALCACSRLLGGTAKKSSYGKPVHYPNVEIRCSESPNSLPGSSKNLYKTHTIHWDVNCLKHFITLYIDLLRSKRLRPHLNEGTSTPRKVERQMTAPATSLGTVPFCLKCPL